MNKATRARKSSIILLILLAILALFAFFPLRIAIGMVAPKNSAISAKAVGGSIWNGSIADLKIGPIS